MKTPTLSSLSAAAGLGISLMASCAPNLGEQADFESSAQAVRSSEVCGERCPLEPSASPSCIVQDEALHYSDLPSNCTQLSGEEIGSDLILSVAGYPVFVENWVSNSPGRFVGFEYRGLEDLHVSVLAGGHTYLDNSGTWMNPDRDGGAPIFSAVLCSCAASAPEPPSCGDDRLSCARGPDCASGRCLPLCGDGVQAPGERCDDGNTQNGDGCSDQCRVEVGFSCASGEAFDQVSLAAKYRDFKGSDLGGHPDFEREGPTGAELGLVQHQLGSSGLPVANPDQLGGAIASQASFATWFADSVQSTLVPGEITLHRQDDGSFMMDEPAFFPLDASCGNDSTLECSNTELGQEPERMGADGEFHNFSFTTELRYPFRYTGTASLWIGGDDDVWVFINRRLAIDLGGVQSNSDGYLELTPDVAQSLDLKLGNTYEIAIFQAERKTPDSSFRLGLQGFRHERSQCESVCGDNILAADEACDDGINDGSYGGCNPGCQTPAPRCGDGYIDTDYEACDDGNQIDGDGCSATCQVETNCPFEDAAVCSQDPCANNPEGFDCRVRLEDYCSLHPREFACEFDACSGGWGSLTDCRTSVIAYCMALSIDPRCS